MADFPICQTAKIKSAPTIQLVQYKVQLKNVLFCKDCSEYDGRNYDCSALSEVMPCPSNMMCQRRSVSKFCVPCQCNIIPDDASCSDGCINNVCVPRPILTTAPPTCEFFILFI